MSTLLTMAEEPPRDDQPAGRDTTNSPTKDVKPEDEFEPGPFADPSAISRRETIAPSEKPWLVENVTEADYKQDEDEDGDEADKNFYKEQSERQRGAGASEWTRNRRKAVHRPESSPSSCKARPGMRSDVTGANTPPMTTVGSGFAHPSDREANGARVQGPTPGTAGSETTGCADAFTNGAVSLPGAETTPSSDPFSELSRRSQPAVTSESPRSSDSKAVSGTARNSDPVTSAGAAVSALPNSQMLPEKTEEVRQTFVPFADSSSEQGTVATTTGTSRYDSGIEIKVSSETSESLPEILPGGFTPPRLHAGGK